MRKSRLADFFFVGLGLGVAPVALMLGGFPALAVFVLVPLLFVACFFGMAEQLEDDAKPKGETDVEAEVSPRNPPGLTFKQRETAEKQK